MKLIMEKGQKVLGFIPFVRVWVAIEASDSPFEAIVCFNDHCIYMVLSIGLDF